DRHLAQVEGLEEATDRPVRRLTHQHAARTGHLLQTRRQVSRVSHSGIVHAQVVADLANDHQASVEPYAHLQSQSTLHLQLFTVCPQRALHAQGGVYRPAWTVLVRYRGTEQGHHPIPGVLVNCAFETVHLRGDQLETTIDNLVHLLRV